MINRNNLLIETHTLPERMQHDHVMLISFLETMARFHKYNVDEQINIHLHAPSSAVALASAAIWQKYFNTSIIADAQPTPILKNAQTSNETIEYIYDLVDTESFQAGKFNLTDIYWQYSDSDKTVVKNYLNESDSDSIEKAIHIAVQKQAAIADTDYPSLLAAATEYIIKARLHLPNSSMVINSIDCSSINMKKFLIETNQLAKQFLTPIGKVISAQDQETLEIEQRKRTRQIADPNQYKGDDLTFMMYLSLANEAYLAQGSIWDDKIDQKVTKELKAKGYPNDAIKNAILNCSPACPDKENLDTYINKSVEQKGR